MNCYISLDESLLPAMLSKCWIISFTRGPPFSRFSSSVNVSTVKLRSLRSLNVPSESELNPTRT